MSAYINLLNPALRPRRLVVSARNLALLVAVCVAVMAAVQTYLGHDLGRRRAALAAAHDAHDARVARLSALQGAQRQAAGSELGAEIGRLEAELRAQREAVALLRSGAAGARQGYAEYLRAFSRGAVNGLWLTGFTISGSGDITLRGRLLRADLLPQYMGRLSAQPILSGRSFSTLDVAQPVGGDAGGDYLEFMLASSERQAVAAAGARAP